MTQHENDPLFAPPLAQHLGDGTATAAGAASGAAPDGSPQAADAPRRGLLRTLGLPVALAAAGLMTGAALTGVAMAAGTEDDAGIGTGISAGDAGGHDRGPALTIPDQDGTADGSGSGGASGGFTLPDQADGPTGQLPGGHGDRGAPPSGTGLPSRTSTGASA